MRRRLLSALRPDHAGRSRPRSRARRPFEPTGDGYSEEHPSGRKERTIGIEDKARNVAQGVAGRVKEGVGRLTDDERLVAEGRADQAEAAAGKRAEKAKDAATDELDR